MGHDKEYIRLILPGPVYEYRPPKGDPFPRWSREEKETADAQEDRPEGKGEDHG